MPEQFDFENAPLVKPKATNRTPTILDRLESCRRDVVSMKRRIRLLEAQAQAMSLRLESLKSSKKR